MNMGITKILHTFTGQGLHEFTILSIMLALIGFLFLSYEFLGRPYKVLRIALQIITPALATALPWILCILLFLWFPAYQKLVFIAWLAIGGLSCLYISWSLRKRERRWFQRWASVIVRALASVIPWVLLTWIYLTTNQASTFELFSIVFATIAGMIGAFHGVIIAFFDKEPTDSPTHNSETVFLDEKEKASSTSTAQRLKDSSKHIPFRLLYFLEGFLAGFIFVFVFWVLILTLVFGFAWYGFDTIVGSAIVGGLGGIAGGLWRGFFRLPAGGWTEVKKQLKSFFQSCSQLKQRFFGWLKPNPFLKLSQWTTHPQTIKPDTEEPVATENILRRPAILLLGEGKFGFRLWLWTSYIFLIIAICIFFGLRFLLFTDYQAATASIGISHQEEAFLVQVVALITVIVGLAALVVGPISGWFAGGISKFTRWSILYSPAKNLGVFGLFLTLIAFMLQLVEPLASLSHTTFTDTTFKVYSATVDALAWSPDGNYIASGSINGNVRVWNAITTANATTNTYIQVASFNIGNADFFLTFLAWSPDDAYLVLGTSNTNADHGTLQVWNAMTGTVSFIKQYRYGIFAVAWSPDGTRLAWGDVKGNIYNSNWIVDETTNNWDVATKKIYSCSNNSTQQEWDPITSRIVSFTQQKWNPVTAIAWSPDGKSIAAVGEDNTVRVWKANNGQNIITYNPPSNLGDAFRGIFNAIDSIAWSPDSSHIASSSEDGTVQVWEAYTGDNMTTYRGHIHNDVPYAVLRVAWSPDGKRIASSGTDETLQVWEVI
jgi:WD40 repeat protein